MLDDTDNLPVLQARAGITLAEIGNETAIAIRDGREDYFVSAKDIVHYCAPGAPVHEAKKFLLVCKLAGLNPLLGDIDLLPFSGKWQAVVRKNGYLKCARRDPDYDGHESGVSVQAFTRLKDNRILKTGEIIDVQGTVIPEGLALVGGWCKMYRKGISRPTYKRVSISEYMKDAPGPWRAIPCTMIEKVAIAHACRELFDLVAPTYDEAELPYVQSRAVTGRVEPMTKLEAAEQTVLPTRIELPNLDDRATESQVAEIVNLVVKTGMSAEATANMLVKRGVKAVHELDRNQASDILSKLRFHASRAEWEPLGGTPEASPTTPSVETESPWKSHVSRPLGSAPTTEENIIDVESREIPEIQA